MKKFVKALFTCVVVWVAITSGIQRFKDPKLTETELVLLIPENFILNFKKP